MSQTVVYAQVETWDRDYYFERLCFAAMLEDYIPRRPRTYRDRKWLEGYCEMSQGIRDVLKDYPYIPVHMIGSFIKQMEQGNLTASQKGHCDALLDSIGC